MRPNKSNGRLFRLKQSRQVSANALELSPIPEQRSREQLRDPFVAGSALMDPTADNEVALKQEPASDQVKPFVTKANVAKQESTDMKSNAVTIKGEGLNYIDEAKLASEIDSLSKRAVSILARAKKKLEDMDERLTTGNQDRRQQEPSTPEQGGADTPASSLNRTDSLASGFSSGEFETLQPPIRHSFVSGYSVSSQYSPVIEQATHMTVMPQVPTAGDENRSVSPVEPGGLSISKVRESTHQLASLLSEIKSLRRNTSSYSTPGVALGPPTPVSVVGVHRGQQPRTHVLHTRSKSLPDAAAADRPTAPMADTEPSSQDASPSLDQGYSPRPSTDSAWSLAAGKYLRPAIGGKHERTDSGISAVESMESYQVSSLGEARMEEFAAQGAPDLVSGSRPTPPPALQPPPVPRTSSANPSLPVLPRPLAAGASLRDEITTFLYPPTRRSITPRSDDGYPQLPVPVPPVPFARENNAASSSADSFITARSRSSEDVVHDALESPSSLQKAKSMDTSQPTKPSLSPSSSNNTVKPSQNWAETLPLRVRPSSQELGNSSRSSPTAQHMPHYSDEQRDWLPPGSIPGPSDALHQHRRVKSASMAKTSVSSDQSGDLSYDSQELLGLGASKQYQPHMSPVEEEGQQEKDSNGQPSTQNHREHKHHRHHHFHHRPGCSAQHRRVRSQNAVDIRNSATPNIDFLNRASASSRRSAFSQPNVQRLLNLADETLRLDDIDLPPDERHLLEKFVDALSKLSVEINVDDGKRIEGKRRLHNALRAIEGWI